MKISNRIKYYLIKLVTFIAFAVAIFIIRDSFVAHLKYSIGGLMIVYAIEEVLFEVLSHQKAFYKADKIYFAFAEFVLGIVLLCAPIEFTSVCVIWAVWSILRECYEFKDIMLEWEHITPRVLSGLESIAVIAFSITLIIEAGEHHAMIHVYLLLVELLLAPLVPLLDDVITLAFAKKKKKEEENNQ